MVTRVQRTLVVVASSSVAGSVIGSSESCLTSAHNGFSTIGDLQLAENHRDMVANRLGADPKLLTNDAD